MDGEGSSRYGEHRQVLSVISMLEHMTIPLGKLFTQRYSDCVGYGATHYCKCILAYFDRYAECGGIRRYSRYSIKSSVH